MLARLGSRRPWVLYAGRACALALAAACASGPAGVTDALRHGRVADAIAAYERAQKPDPESLRRIAAILLEQEAQSRDPRRRRQALSALAVSRPLALAALERLARRAPDAELRAAALAQLARFGDADARLALLARLDDPDREVRAAAVELLDPERDLRALLALCDAPFADVRRAAVQRLAQAKPSAEIALALRRAASHDPSTAVRAAAVTALGRQGPVAFDALEELLGDPQPSLRLLAIPAIADADRARALPRLERYLSDDPSVEGVEAARVLAQADPLHVPPSARSLLERALASRDNAVRAAAAVALMSLSPLSPRAPELAGIAAARLGHESVRGVRLCLALALGPAGREELAKLGEGADVVAVEALAELARAGGDAGDGKGTKEKAMKERATKARATKALVALVALAKNKDAVVRRVAVSALGRELGRAHEVRDALVDEDASVRIAAAGAILSG